MQQHADNWQAGTPNQPAAQGLGRPGSEHAEPSTQSTGELLHQLSRETTHLVKQELQLARAELAEKGRQAGLGAGLFGGAGVAGLMMLGTLTAAGVLALALVMDAWLAALLVALVWAVIAAVMAVVGRNKVQQATHPVEETTESMKEDARWVQTQMRSGRK